MVLRASAVMIMADVNRKRPNAIYTVLCCTCSSELTVVFIYCSADSPAVCGARCYQVISGALSEHKMEEVSCYMPNSRFNVLVNLSGGMIFNLYSYTGTENFQRGKTHQLSFPGGESKKV